MGRNTQKRVTCYLFATFYRFKEKGVGALFAQTQKSTYRGEQVCRKDFGYRNNIALFGKMGKLNKIFWCMEHDYYACLRSTVLVERCFNSLKISSRRTPH